MSNEHLPLIRALEKALVARRGFVFKMPKPNEPVILLLSGGLDSASTWKILVEKYKLHVHPLVLQDSREPRRGEARAIRKLAVYFRKNFPAHYHKPTFFHTQFLAQEYRAAFDTSLYQNPYAIGHFLDADGHFDVELPGMMTTFALQALQFKNYLLFTHNLTVNTIFSSVVHSDGEAVIHQTRTASRATMAALCAVTNNPRLQYTSLAFEPSIFGKLLDTVDLVRLQKTRKPPLPVEHTWSCLNDGWRQCGGCRSCINRRAALRDAGITDQTRYATGFSLKKNILDPAKQTLKRWLHYDQRFE